MAGISVGDLELRLAIVLSPGVNSVKLIKMFIISNF